MPKTFDLSLIPIYRLRGDELPTPPGLLALKPPRRKARSRKGDLLVLHLVLGGNATLSTVNYLQITSRASEAFYKTPGSVTAALRAAATSLNIDLVEHNMAASGQGRYSLANLVLGAVRGEQLYILESGSAHVYWMISDEREDIHAPDMSGRGLGLGQAVEFYLSQIPLRAGGRLLISPKLPAGWMQILQRDNSSASLETIRSVLMRQSMEDHNAILIEVQPGRGDIKIIKPSPVEKPTYESVSKKISEKPTEEKEETSAEIESHSPEPHPIEIEGLAKHDIEVLEKLGVKIKSEESIEVEEIEKDDVETLAEDAPAEVPSLVEETKPPQERSEIAAPVSQIEVEEEEIAGEPPQAHPIIPDSIPRKEQEVIPEEKIESQKKPIIIPDSIPRAEPVEEKVEPPPKIQEPMHKVLRKRVKKKTTKIRTGPPVHEIIARKSASTLSKATKATTRQSARTLAKGMQVTRVGGNRLKDFFVRMLPRLLPSRDSKTPVSLPTWTMALIAIIVPIIVAIVASVVYSQFGGDLQYDTRFAEAQALRIRAIEEDDIVAKRVIWENTIKKIDEAEEYDTTSASHALREEAQTQLDALLGILRIPFQETVKELPGGVNISAMAASDTELFMLDSEKGEILRAFRIDKGYQFDDSFICRGGDYGEHTLGALVDLATLPTSNAMGASVLGIDKDGNLLYCTANRVPQAMSLFAPSVGFKEITDIALDNGILYILDAPSRELWRYAGQAYTFNNHPTAFFENAPEGINYTKGMSIKGSDLYLLFSDGHLASCTASLLTTVPTRCINPAPLNDPHPAAGGGNSFALSVFSQIYLSTPPDSALLLFSPEKQAIFRFSPRAFALQNQFRPAQGTIQEGTLSAMTSNPGHVLFVAQGDKIYMAADTP